MTTVISLEAGSSSPAGFPSTQRLTDLVLSGDGVWKFTDETYSTGIRRDRRYAKPALSARPNCQVITGSIQAIAQNRYFKARLNPQNWMSSVSDSQRMGSPLGPVNDAWLRR